jgi:pyruvate kinase
MINMAKPKIICTLGTTTDSKQVLEEMVKNGMDCARMNTAYATIDEYQGRLDTLREVDPNIEVMMDIKGPQVRLEADQAYNIDKGDIIYVGFKDEPLHFNKTFYSDVKVGDKVFFENGTIKTEVCKKENLRLSLRILNAGEGKIHKQMGVSVPDKYLHVDRLSKKDHEVIEFTVLNDVDYIALSFVRDYDDVKHLYGVIESYKKRYGSTKDIGIVAKIEDWNGAVNLDEILQKAKKDEINLSVMVARGDLYVELAQEELPYVQSHIIDLCKKYNVPVIAATGFLESMQQNTSPSRAEVCDVYNALVEGANAFMLSGETSNGKHPALVVKKMNDLLERYEKCRK